MDRSLIPLAARLLAVPYLACGALLTLFVARGGVLWLPFAPPLGAPVLLPAALLWLGTGGVLVARTLATERHAGDGRRRLPPVSGDSVDLRAGRAYLSR